MSTKPKYYIVESSALPEVFLKVAEAKRLLSTGEASTVNEATRMTDISRSAFYKYRDAVLPFQSMMTGRIITFQLLLHDEQGHHQFHRSHQRYGGRDHLRGNHRSDHDAGGTDEPPLRHSGRAEGRCAGRITPYSELQNRRRCFLRRFSSGSTAQFGKKSQPGFLFQFKVSKMEEYCMYFPFLKLRKWGKKTAETRRRNCAVLPSSHFAHP